MEEVWPMPSKARVQRYAELVLVDGRVYKRRAGDGDNARGENQYGDIVEQGKNKLALRIPQG